MRYLKAIVHFDVLIVHFLVRAVMLEFSTPAKRAERNARSEMRYLDWEQKQIFAVYLFPLLTLFVAGFIPFVIVYCLIIFVAILRSIEHIDKNIIN